ncbi:hypothetical protein A343_0980 [Porphyromonas gingivalis JCVI SC001]|nr:hypothetical protein A343_0980 [Porphyromonas gingivalis JCVI SC001]
MVKPHQFDTQCDVSRFCFIERFGTPRQSVAKSTGTCTDITTDHEGSSPSTPALSHIGAFATCTDRMQTMSLDNAFSLGKLLIPTKTYFQPFGFLDVLRHSFFNEELLETTVEQSK